MPKKKKNNPGRVTLSEVNVDPSVRHGFNQTCKQQGGQGRGDVLTELMEEWVLSQWPTSGTGRVFIERHHCWLVSEEIDRHERLERDGADTDSSLDKD